MPDGLGRAQDGSTRSPPTSRAGSPRSFLPDPARGGRRAAWGDNEYFQTDPHWKDCIPFNEYFNGDTGAGLGASHQTGWTAVVGALLLDYGGRRGGG